MLQIVNKIGNKANLGTSKCGLFSTSGAASPIGLKWEFARNGNWNKAGDDAKVQPYTGGNLFWFSQFSFALCLLFNQLCHNVHMTDTLIFFFYTKILRLRCTRPRIKVMWLGFPDRP